MKTELIEQIKSNDKNLKQLELTRNRIGDAEAKILADALSDNDVVETLYLGENQIGVIGATSLAAMLVNNKTIAKIYLQNNNIGSDGAKSIAEMLKVNNTIKMINLGENLIGADGIEAIAKALKINQTLGSISLWNNNINTETAKPLIMALEINKTLASINLGWNLIGTNGIAMFIEAIQNSNIISIDLENLFIDDKLRNEIDKVIENNLKKTLSHCNYILEHYKCPDISLNTLFNQLIDEHLPHLGLNPCDNKLIFKPERKIENQYPIVSVELISDTYLETIEKYIEFNSDICGILKLIVANQISLDNNAKLIASFEEKQQIENVSNSFVNRISNTNNITISKN